MKRLINTIRNYWQDLSIREQGLIAVALTFLFGTVYVTQGLQAGLDKQTVLSKSLVQKQQNLIWMNRVSGKITAFYKTHAKSQKSLLDTVKDTLKRKRVIGTIISGSDQESVKLRVDKSKFNELYDLLVALEKDGRILLKEASLDRVEDNMVKGALIVYRSLQK